MSQPLPPTSKTKPAAGQPLDQSVDQRPGQTLGPAGSQATGIASRATIVLRFGGNAVSLRLRRRTLITCAALSLACLAVVVLSLASGDYALSPVEIIRALAGQGDEMQTMIVVQWRLPRALLALLLGACLGISGAIFQSLTRNPLGSPDVIGFSAGAHTGALVSILILSGGYVETASGALVGGLATATAVYLLTYRSGIEGFRLIVVGIAIAAMLSAANVWMIRRADLQIAMSAATWAAGSLNGLGFDRLVPTAIAALPLLMAATALSRPMRQLELGDDAAIASGVRADPARLALVAIGVALVAVVTAAAGPIAFVALAAPQLARRMAATAGTTMLTSALVGGLLLLAADWCAQHAFGLQMPVGIMTFNIGGLYFLWLLIREGRK